MAGHACSGRAASTILQQVPSGGRLKQGKSVRVVLSLGPRPVPVPHLANLTESQADAALEAAGLRPAVPVKRESSMTVPAGVVITSAPSGGTLVSGPRRLAHRVHWKASRAGTRAAGRQCRQLHHGLGRHEAGGLQAVQSSAYSNTVPKGAVISTQPPAGTSVVVGSQVTVQVRSAPIWWSSPTSTATR